MVFSIFLATKQVLLKNIATDKSAVPIPSHLSSHTEVLIYLRLM